MNWNIVRLFFVIGLSVGLGSCQSGIPGARDLQQITKSTQDMREYAAIRLDNELQVVVVSDPTLENAVASLIVHAGSAQDPEQFPGLAHYLEHMLFQGTAKYPEPNGFMKFVETNGGGANASTAFNNTHYFFQINAGKLDQALDQFSDYFKKPTFDPVYSDKERQAVHNEWSLRQANDQYILHRLACITASPESPSQKFNLGNIETLKDSPEKSLHQAMQDYYQEYYSANLMKLVIIGNQTIPELKALAVKHFLSIPNHKKTLPKVSHPGLTKKEMAKLISYKPQQDIKALYIEFPISNNIDQWRYKPNELIRAILSSSDKGTLVDYLREQQFITNANIVVLPDFYMADGVLRIELELTAKGLASRDQIIAAAFSYIDLLKSEGISETYFKEQQELANKSFTSGSRPEPLFVAININSMQFYGLPVQHLLDGPFLLKEYSSSVINELMTQLQPHNARIWFVDSQQQVNKSIPFYQGQYAIRDIESSELDQWLSMSKSIKLNLPRLNDLATNTGIPLVDFKYVKPHLVISQPGVEAFLVHSQHFQKEGNGAIHVQINSPVAEASIKNRLMAELLNDIYKRQLAGLKDKAQRVGLTVDTFITAGDSQQLKVAGYSEKLTYLMQKMLDEFIHLSFNQDTFSQVALEQRQFYENNLTKTGNDLVYGHLNRLVSEITVTQDEWLKTLDTIRYEDLQQFHQTLLKQNLLRLLIAGNFSDEQTKNMALDFSQRMSSSIDPEKRRLWEYQPPAQKQLIQHNIDSALTDNALMWAWFGKQKSDDEQAQMVVLNSVMHAAFYRQLRTEEQLGYLVHSASFPVDDVAGVLMAVQSSSADLPTIYQRMQKFRNDFLLSLEQMDENTILAARDAVIANQTQQAVNFYQESDRHWAEYLHGKYTFDGRDRYLAALKKVDKASLLTLYKSFILDKNAGQIMIQVRGKQFGDKPFASPEQ